MYLITWITSHLPTPEGWMAELAMSLTDSESQSHILCRVRKNTKRSCDHDLSSLTLLKMIVRQTLAWNHHDCIIYSSRHTSSVVGKVVSIMFQTQTRSAQSSQTRLYEDKTWLCRASWLIARCMSAQG